MNQSNMTAQLKSLEVFQSGVPVYKWETRLLGDYPAVIVLSKGETMLWGHEICAAMVQSDQTMPVQILENADRVLAEWMDGQVEIMTDDDTRIFKPGEGWREYWNSLDQWPREIEEKGGAK